VLRPPGPTDRCALVPRDFILGLPGKPARVSCVELRASRSPKIIPAKSLIDGNYFPYTKAKSLSNRKIFSFRRSHKSEEMTTIHLKKETEVLTAVGEPPLLKAE
jgi:hypothetical protein